MRWSGLARHKPVRAAESVLEHPVTATVDIMKPLTPIDASAYREPHRRGTRWGDVIPVAVGAAAGTSIALTGRYRVAVAVTVVWLAGMYAWRVGRRSTV